MTNNADNNDNMDAFDGDDLGQPSAPGAAYGDDGKKPGGLAGILHSRPMLKLAIIMGVVGLAAAAALGAFSEKSADVKSNVVSAPDLNEAPGSKASPYFIDQNRQANAQRAAEASQSGGSAIPTPVGQNVDVSELMNKKSDDQLVEFRAETERLRQEMRQQEQRNAQQIQVIQQQSQRPEDDSLAQAMQKQMQQLMESWTPKEMKLVNGVLSEKDKEREAQAAQQASLATQQNSAAEQTVEVDKILVPSGTVSYAQLLTEANSDVPSPILAQILSGPLAGGRAVGRFQVSNDYLVLEFNTVSLKGKEYSINALALDPDTTLGGLATEVDHRYFMRVVLPAAAAFASEFGQSLGDTESTVYISNGTVFSTQAKKGMEDALYSGMGRAGDSVAQFLQDEASKIKPLIRVAVGAPMGLFFLNPVQESGRSSGGFSSLSDRNNAAAQAMAVEALNAANANRQQQAPQQVYPASQYSAYPDGRKNRGGVTVITPNQNSGVYYNTSGR